MIPINGIQTAQVASNVTTTGRYPWSLTVFIPGGSNLTPSGTTFVRAEDASPLGAGWTFYSPFVG